MKMILLTEGETMSRLFDLDWQLLADSCLMIIAIFVLFLALSYFLFNPARKFLNDRKEKIRGELEEAKDNQEKAAELKAQYEAKLKDIDKEAEDILSDARRRALQNEERIVTQAKEEAARILARAQEEARLEKQKKGFFRDNKNKNMEYDPAESEYTVQTPCLLYTSDAADE